MAAITYKRNDRGNREGTEQLPTGKEQRMYYDKIIIGAGLYGLYSALFCGKRGEHVLVLECDKEPFRRATYINQARVHMGYHYPRSLSTAIKSAGYFERFVENYPFCINQEFRQVYAISREFSWTDEKEFEKFCQASGIFCERVHEDTYFNEDMCGGAFLTREYTYDAMKLKSYFLDELAGCSNVEIRYEVSMEAIREAGNVYEIVYKNGKRDEAPFILNASYASTNQIAQMAGMETFQIKYELCEIILVRVNSSLEKLGLTVMDGPFFSIMPFGMTGLHSLTSVTFTPHITSHEKLPVFRCQKNTQGMCSPEHLYNCNLCPEKPETAFPYMEKLARKYMKKEYEFFYESSLFSMKPILMTSEIDDSRPTVIRKLTEKPTFVSVLSGKINTVFDLDEVLANG